MAAETFLTRQAQAVAEPLLVSEPEAARLLGGLCLKSMYLLRRRGLPFVRIGSRIMYSPADLATWIEQRKGAQHE